MLSTGLIKGLVYGALAASLIVSLVTIIAVILGTAGQRRRRWSWALAVPMGVCTLAGWFWFYPSYLAGTSMGMDLGALAGRHLGATTDAILMAAGIGLVTYIVFCAPLALLAIGLSLGVTTTQPAVEPRRPDWLEFVRGLWAAAAKRIALARQGGAAARTP
jgi:hypothetical protein